MSLEMLIFLHSSSTDSNRSLCRQLGHFSAPFATGLSSVESAHAHFVSSRHFKCTPLPLAPASIDSASAQLIHSRRLTLYRRSAKGLKGDIEREVWFLSTPQASPFPISFPHPIPESSCFLYPVPLPRYSLLSSAATLSQSFVPQTLSCSAPLTLSYPSNPVRNVMFPLSRPTTPQTSSCSTFPLLFPTPYLPYLPLPKPHYVLLPLLKPSLTALIFPSLLRRMFNPLST